MATTQTSRFPTTAFSGSFQTPSFPAQMAGVNGIAVDFQMLFDAHRKNVEALTEAQNLAFENMQAIVQFQADLVNRIVRNNSNFARDIMAVSTPEQKAVHQTDMIKSAYESSIGGLRELTEMISKSNLETSDVLCKRVSATLTEIKSSLEKEVKAAVANRQKAVA